MILTFDPFALIEAYLQHTEILKLRLREKFSRIILR